MPMHKVSVFGNEVDKNDSLPLKFIPGLKKRYPKVDFLVQDPTESLEPSGDPWIIIDSAIGLHHVTMIESLEDLEYIKGSSVHDFDVYMELRLQAKIGKLPKIKIILIPQTENSDHALSHIYQILDQIF